MQSGSHKYFVLGSLQVYPFLGAYKRYLSLILDLDWRGLLESCGRLLSAADEVPEENLFKLRVTDMALDACVHLRLWEEAVTYGMKTLPAYRSVAVGLLLRVQLSQVTAFLYVKN